MNQKGPITHGPKGARPPVGDQVGVTLDFDNEERLLIGFQLMQEIQLRRDCY
ncbi:MAG: hypothetical protein CM1200mP12_13900 [Gammaproteobacteria bacterium]|nr:MAG: hypothetical protein CM1200mP12_13900 [Gammaproteobacteria bacterium]